LLQIAPLLARLGRAAPLDGANNPAAAPSWTRSAAGPPAAALRTQT
jgi:hypothetical protein